MKYEHRSFWLHKHKQPRIILPQLLLQLTCPDDHIEGGYQENQWPAHEINANSWCYHSLFKNLKFKGSRC